MESEESGLTENYKCGICKDLPGGESHFLLYPLSHYSFPQSGSPHNVFLFLASISCSTHQPNLPLCAPLSSALRHSLSLGKPRLCWMMVDESSGDTTGEVMGLFQGLFWSKTPSAPSWVCFIETKAWKVQQYC